MEINLEKVDKVIERTGVSYAEAKNALEESNGDVLEAIIYIENIKKFKKEESSKAKAESIDEFKKWLKDIIEKGNVTRIRISKDEKEIVDVPVNAGIAAGIIAVMMPAVLAFGVVAAVVSKITIEITKDDGSVEVVNKYISKTVGDFKDTATDVASKIKSKITEVKKDKFNNNYKIKHEEISENSFTYTVKLDDEE